MKRGRQEGGFPDWLVEYNRNMLKSCAPEAILFTGGDADTDSAWYLQYVEHFRQDVTVIPVGALKRPWYVLTIKEKARLIPMLAPMSWSKDQILAMRPYKWKPNKIIIPISEAVRKKYQLGNEIQQMEWLVEPNLLDNQRTYLSTDMSVEVDFFGISNWVRTLKSIPSWWEAFRDALYKELPGFLKLFQEKLDCRFWLKLPPLR
ncbi:MAG: hypothetical protein ACE5NG_12020 [bacterium]